MTLKARTHAFDSKHVAALASAALVAALMAGCGGNGGTGTARTGRSAADFIRQITTQFSLGQTGPLWDTLIPADQAIVTRARYMECHTASGFDLQKFKVLQTYPDTVVVAGKATPATAVSVRVTADDGVTIATMHAVRVSGTWRWILSAADSTAYKQGKCPSS